MLKTKTELIFLIKISAGPPYLESLLRWLRALSKEATNLNFFRRIAH